MELMLFEISGICSFFIILFDSSTERSIVNFSEKGVKEYIM